MPVEAVVEVRTLTTDVRVLEEPETIIEVLVGAVTTQGVVVGTAVIEVLVPQQPALNTYGVPVTMAASGTIPEFACLVIGTGATTVTLPNPLTLRDGRFIEVKNTAAAPLAVTPGAFTIDGSSSPLTLNQWESARVVVYDENWLRL